MNVGIIGSGGRENAICLSLTKSKRIKNIYCLPGNAGTVNISKNLNVNIENFQEIKKAVEINKIDLLVVGPEKPLVNGIVDYFNNTNVKIFGPNKAASQLEGSKIFKVVSSLCIFNIREKNSLSFSLNKLIWSFSLHRITFFK